MTRKQTSQRLLLLLLWPPWLLLLWKLLQVSSCNDNMPGSARMLLCAHSTPVCVTHVAV
jgi:hypothetical protein